MNQDLSNNPLFQALESQKMQPTQVSQPVSSGLESNPLFQALQAQEQGAPQQKGGFFNPKEGTFLNKTVGRKGKNIYGGQKGLVRELLAGVSRAGQDTQTMFDKIQESGEMVRSGEISAGRGALQSIGQVLGTGGKILGDATIKIGEMILPEFAERALMKPLNRTMEAVANTQAAQNLAQKYESLSPAAKLDVDAATKSVGALMELAGLKGFGKGASAVASGAGYIAQSVLEKGVTETVKSVARYAADVAGNVAGRALNTVAPVLSYAGRITDGPLRKSIETNLRNAGVTLLEPEEALAVMSSTQKALIRAGMGGEDIQKSIGTALKMADSEKAANKFGNQITSTIESKGGVWNSYKKLMGNDITPEDAGRKVQTIVMDTLNKSPLAIDDMMVGSGIAPRKLADAVRKFSKEIGDTIGELQRADTHVFDMRDLTSRLDEYLSEANLNRMGIKIDAAEIDNFRERVMRGIRASLDAKSGPITAKKSSDIFKIINDTEFVPNASIGTDITKNKVKLARRSILRQFMQDFHPDKDFIEGISKLNEYYGETRAVTDLLNKMPVSLDFSTIKGMKGILSMAVGYGAGSAASGPLSALAFPAGAMLGDKMSTALTRAINVRKSGLGQIAKNASDGVLRENIFRGSGKVKDIAQKANDVLRKSRLAREELSSLEYYDEIFSNLDPLDPTLSSDVISSIQRDINQSIEALNEIKKELRLERQASASAKTMKGTASKRTITELDIEIAEAEKEIQAYKNMLKNMPTAQTTDVSMSGYDELSRTGLFR